MNRCLCRKVVKGDPYLTSESNMITDNNTLTESNEDLDVAFIVMMKGASDKKELVLSKKKL